MKTTTCSRLILAPALPLFLAKWEFFVLKNVKLATSFFERFYRGSWKMKIHRNKFLTLNFWSQKFSFCGRGRVSRRHSNCTHCNPVSVKKIYCVWRRLEYCMIDNYLLILTIDHLWLFRRTRINLNPEINWGKNLINFDAWIWSFFGGKKVGVKFVFTLFFK